MNLEQHFLNNKKIKYYIENLPLLLNSEYSRDRLVFSKMIELSFRYGVWWGNVGQS